MGASGLEEGLLKSGASYDEASEPKGNSPVPPKAEKTQADHEASEAKGKSPVHTNAKTTAAAQGEAAGSST